MHQLILLTLCLLFVNIYHAIALPALPPPNLTALNGPYSQGVFVTDCSIVTPSSRIIQANDCFDAIDQFQERVEPPGLLPIDFICTYDIAKAHNPSYVLLPDSETVGSCEVAWDIPHRTDVLVSWDSFSWFSRHLVHECLGGNRNGGVNEWGYDVGHIVQFKVWSPVWSPDFRVPVEVGNGTMRGSVDVN